MIDTKPAAPNALPTPYLLFLGDVTETGFAKTAFALRDWAPDSCTGEYVLPGGKVSTGLQPMTPAQAASQGARSLLIGVASPGGIIPASWYPALFDALDAGLDIVNGLHTKLSSVPKLHSAAQDHGRRLIELRRPPEGIPSGTGTRRGGKRLLTVGTDCAIGKKYTALSLAQAMSRRGMLVDFRATGQTGIMIAGSGIPVDAVVSDFISGAAETLSPDAPDEHWDVIEGQGTLVHPAFAAVSMGLLHGSQPDVFVICHEPGRKHLVGYPDFPTPTIEEIIDLTVRLGRYTNPAIRCAGVAMNTSALSEDAAYRLLAAESNRLGLAVADPVRGGQAFESLVSACISD
ncbi:MULTISPECIES: DUF1611 domain-containing protein [unclassified Wenzhouxiangella]|uniref:DUF1611 domain-containing protein n=1 Tax=unclassified Wenzhouxiangella TaxID=2613841 RepID=UPI000E325CAC|nr:MULTISPECIES: DUF1611 domain-containing protein [unclassified Wenzhouxiangella]RFF28045.1 DUF1611 domain-containing protein [Wenzhouxiangella sp. 15181]RFP68631.1 DUF1611 domain-containing protein [Wenzhouxiangella sp. 15190]